MAVGHALQLTYLAGEQPVLFTSIDIAWKRVCWYSSKVSCCDLPALEEELQLWIKESSIK